jgi:hypothetical protein
MRKVIATTFFSLDGAGGPEEDTDGGFAHAGWVFHYWDDMMEGVMDIAMKEPFDLLLDRRSLAAG